MFDTIADMLRGSAPDDLAHALGTDRTQTRRAMEIGLPALIAGLRDKSLEPGGAQELTTMLESPGAQLPGDVPEYLQAGDPAQGAALLDVAFGDRGEPALSALSGASGLSTRLLAQVMSVLAPLATGTLANADTGTDGVRSYLAGSVDDLETKGFGRVVELVSPALPNAGIEAESDAADAAIDLGGESSEYATSADNVVEGAFPDPVSPEPSGMAPVAAAGAMVGGVAGAAASNVPGLTSPDVGGSVSTITPAAPDYAPLPGDMTSRSADGLKGKASSPMRWIWWAVAALLAIVALVFILTQCGGDDNATTTDTATSTEPAPTPTVDPQLQVRQAALDQAIAPYPGVTGEVVGTVAVLEGSVPDQSSLAMLDQAARGVSGLTGVSNQVAVAASATAAGYSINEVAAAQGELSRFKSLLDEAGLSQALEGNGPFTVFAPTNEAFAAIETQLAELQGDRDALQDILRYHVVSGAYGAADVASLPSLNTQQGEVITVSADAGQVRLNDSAAVLVSAEDPRNGVLHIISSVLLPPSAQPAPAAAVPEEIGAYLGLSPIEFSPGSADLTVEGQLELDRVVEYLIAAPTTVEIGGHTDSDGSSELNQSLSQQRADAVLAYMTGKGVPADWLRAFGYGEDNPIADNATEDGKSANRRIEFRTP